MPSPLTCFLKKSLKSGDLINGARYFASIFLRRGLRTTFLSALSCETVDGEVKESDSTPSEEEHPPACESSGDGLRLSGRGEHTRGSDCIRGVENPEDADEILERETTDDEREIVAGVLPPLLSRR